MALGHQPAKRAEVNLCPLFAAVHREHSCLFSVSVITSAEVNCGQLCSQLPKPNLLMGVAGLGRALSTGLPSFRHEWAGLFELPLKILSTPAIRTD